VQQIQNKMDLSKFPFDSDVIEFEMGSKYMGSKKLVFQRDPDFDHLKTVVSEGLIGNVRDSAGQVASFLSLTRSPRPRKSGLSRALPRSSATTATIPTCTSTSLLSETTGKVLFYRSGAYSNETYRV
jgi:hypothetical protein